MKNALLAVATGLVLAYAAVAWQSGRSAEAEFNRLTAAADAAATLPIALDRHYRRGWFRSEFDVTLRPANRNPVLQRMRTGPDSKGSDELKVTLHGVVYHGPVAGAACFGSARTEITLELSDAVRAQLKPALGSSEPVLIDSCRGFFGVSKLVARSPKFATPLKVGDVQVDSDGFDFTVRTSQGGRSWTVAGSLPRVEVTGPNDARVELHGLRVDGQQTLVKDPLYDGAVRLSVDSFSGSGANAQSPVDMKAFSMESRSASAGGFTALHYATGFGPLRGPTFKINEAHMDCSLSHLDSETLVAMAAASRKINADETLTATDRGAKSVAVLKEYGMTLLSKGPELDISRVSIDLDDGSALLTGTVRVADVAPTDTLAEVTRKIEADFDLRVDDAVLSTLGPANRQGAALDQAVAQGFVTRQDGHVETHLRLRHGAVTLNNRPYPQVSGGPQASPAARP